ncbi:methionine synthase II [Lactococcus lactis subsp. lactis]|uniref:Methionine synthase II n=1 Tax=Lactococcus lactis subsp. lactis TaxID=1360 RepID=A0A0B8QZL7_LACLL|nr:methionine synthase II [Lactococcus lactis subsp. lactis]
MTVTMPMEEFDKLEKLALSAHTGKLSVEKLQEQLNSKVKALTEIRANIEEHNQIYDLSVDTALLLEVIDGIAFDALAAIGGDDD